MNDKELTINRLTEFLYDRVSCAINTKNRSSSGTDRDSIRKMLHRELSEWKPTRELSEWKPTKIN